MSYGITSTSQIIDLSTILSGCAAYKSALKDFEKWLIKEGIISGDEDNLTAMDGDSALPAEDRANGYCIAHDTDEDKSDNGGNAGEPSYVHAYYTVFYEGGAVNRVAILGKDHVIYFGNPVGVSRIEEDATSDYQQMLSDQND